MANSNIPTGAGLSVNFLPDFYQTSANKKFLQSTIDQLYQKGTVTKTSGFIGRENAKAATGEDVYVQAADQTRQNYQLEPGMVVQDVLGNVTFFKDYIDYINQLNVFGGNTANHARLNTQEMYSWDPHIDWDKFVNFQNYYWLPYGPDIITIHGQSTNVASTYTVEIQSEGNTNEYLFTPDGLTLNPTLKLYRGQTYTFKINSPGNPFSFMTARSVDIRNRYNISGISSNGVELGNITFTVPNNAPSVLFYQSETDINLGGVIEIFDINSASSLNVTSDILGKSTYTLTSGISLSNGMKVTFAGNVTPELYATGTYYVEGVGASIKLIPTSILEIVNPYTSSEQIQFDSIPFDAEPFSDASGFASTPDYIVVNRASRDHNPWARYNRWFHKDVINASIVANGDTPSLDQSARAVRPIIEFEADLKLFNFGTTAIDDVDLIDTFTSNAFLSVEGSLGYNIDGVQLSEGMNVIFTADLDPLVKNNIYKVTFVNIQGRRQIRLVEVAVPTFNQTTTILQGKINQSKTYWYNGSTWIVGQQKLTTNQPPLFDVVDSSGISYSDTSVYNGSTFLGTTIFSYKVGTGSNDTVLGFPLSYQNVSNIGDIVFDFTLATDVFQYKTSTSVLTKAVDVGYLSTLDYGGNTVYVNGWQICKTKHVQAGVRIYKNSGLTNNFSIDIFDDITNLSDLSIKVYINGVFLNNTHYSVTAESVHYKLVLNTPVLLTDVLTIRTFAAQPINSNGFYEIPLNLQNNPLNDAIGTFTLGEVSAHLNSIVENIDSSTANIRDIGNITQYGTKFVQHSGPLSLGIYHITSESNNIVKAIETSRDDYGTFKRNFIVTASSLGVDGDPATITDLVLQKINANKPNTAPYYFSDMVPYGANITTNLAVVDYRIRTYPLSTVFSLDTLSNKAVGVYWTSNGVKTQLIHGRDYTFSNQAMVVIDSSVKLLTGDTITTVEYDSTDGCFVPATPTKLGIWPAYTPQIYTDTTLVTPRVMIQGHDGSQLLAYGDYRDALILELETRIFNNIKVKYDSTIFDIHDVIPGYSRSSDYSLAEFNQVLAPSFYKWSSLVGVDFSLPLTYDRSNPFTYNYSADTAPDGTAIPGYWRGIYRYMLDTDRPNLCPWEMLGFSICPNWWVSVYGPAPYTSDNLIMWKDIANGVVREPGVPAVTLTKYIRPFLLDHLPVNEEGLLVSPLDCGLANGVIVTNTSGNYVFGDIGPVEATWRRSSYFPFSVLITAMLLNPAKSFGVLLDRSRISKNLAGQLIYTETGLHIRPKDIVLPSVYSTKTRIQTAGIVNYVIDLILNYVFSNNLVSYNSYKSDLENITPQLSYRVGAFTNQNQFNLLLESKTPLATGSVFIPSEDYTVFLNTSSPTQKLTYSGVIITRIANGYEIKGYSKTQPYFKAYQSYPGGTLVKVGGISESYVTWTPNQQYITGQVIKNGSTYYRAISTFTSEATFDIATVVALSSLPLVGGVDAIFRTTWDRSTTINFPYGTVLSSVQDVVDFLLGYEQWLMSQGFIFDTFNNNLASVANWSTSAKEFMFWTTQNWSSGQNTWSEWLPNQAYPYGSVVKYNGEYYSASYNLPTTNIFEFANWTALPGLSNVGAGVISLSPSANGITFTTKLTVVDDISNPFNNYEFFKVDGTPLQPSQLDSYREGNTISYSPRTSDGIYCASFYLIQNEHVIIINNVDMFNDVIYNPPSGYKRDRIKVSGYLTNGWYGGLDIPGFIFDQAQIAVWQPWQDYNMGDIINYQGNYYSSIAFTAGTASFVASSWSQLSKKPNPQILPNWTNIATQFADFYSLDVDSVDTAQQTLAQHLVGYQKRQYLDNIIQDSVSEFKFYQGMIRDKGTQNVLNHLFGVLTADRKESLTFYEEWALRVGRYGAANAFEDLEIVITQSEVKNNPQGFVLTSRVDNTLNSFILQKTPNDLYVKPLGYNSTPFPVLKNPMPLLRSAGYVDKTDVTISLGHLSDITSYNISTLSNGQYVWVAFDDAGWNVYRFTDLKIRVTDVTYANKILIITCENIVPLKSGDYIGLAQVANLAGFYQIADVSLNTITLTTSVSNFVAPFTQQNELVIYGLVPQRVTSIDTLDNLLLTHLKPNTLVWTDDDGTGSWATWQYNPIYKFSNIENPQSELMYGLGSNLAISSDNFILAVGNNDGRMMIYDKIGVNVHWIERCYLDQPSLSIIHPLIPSQTPVASDIATVLALSSDGEWFAAGSPLVGYIATSYRGDWSNTVNNYAEGDIVTLPQTIGYAYYQAINTVPVNSEPSATSLYWQLIPYIPADTKLGSNSTHPGQGVVSLYKKDSNNQFTLVDSFVSPQPADNENFGASIAFGNNVMYISATGANNNTGKIYKLNYKTLVLASASYNPVGSSLSTIVVSSTHGIRAGMVVQGTGFTNNQTVFYVLTRLEFKNDVSLGPFKLSSGVEQSIQPGMFVTGANIITETTVVNAGQSTALDGTTVNYVIVQSTQDLSPNITQVTFGGVNVLTFTATAVVSLQTLVLDNIPDSQPSGFLNFVTTNWTYDWTSQPPSGSAPGSNFGSLLTISKDANTLAVSSTLISGSTSTGSVSIYKNPSNGFTSPQIISSHANDLRFGNSVTISDTDNYIAIANDSASSGVSANQGSVTVYKNTSTGYVFYQSLVNHIPETDGQFGNKIAFMNDHDTLVVYSKNGDTQTSTTFDVTVGGKVETTFDKTSTNFITTQLNNGRVDVYDMYNTKWVFSESLAPVVNTNVGYGTGLAVSSNNIIVSAPLVLGNNSTTGALYEYSKPLNSQTWNIFRNEVKRADVTKIKKAFLYNKKLGKLLTYLDIIDPLQGKIAGPAEEELSYKTFYDPAIYSQGTAGTVNADGFWADQQVGQLWWDLRTAKFLDNSISDIVYRTNSWSALAAGASVDVYEWIATTLQPSQWDTQQGTSTGLALGISGTSLYGNSAYSVIQKFDNVSKTFKNTYYYWVKNKTITPNVAGRNISANSVANLIADPRGQGYTCLGITSTSSFVLVNAAQYLHESDVALAIEYWTIDKTDQNIHSQWSLISNDSIVELPHNIEQKWIDSLCGIDQGGRAVPDPQLPVKLRYGIENRPRQGMFINRIEALKELVENINIILQKNQIVETTDISDLEKFDPAPKTISGLYDIAFDNNTELSYANVGSFTAPMLTPIITNGRITGVTIVAAGFGYVNAPYVTVLGTGEGAIIRTVIDSIGEITGVTIINSGEGYSSSTECLVRSYSALIKSDDTASGAWSIVSYNTTSKLWTRSSTQSYDVRKYWRYADWFGSYTDPTSGKILFTATQFTAPDFSVATLNELNSIGATVGETVKVRTVGTGGWLLLYKYANSTSVDWTQSYATVAIQNGTVQFNSNLYSFSGTDIGYDSNIFDNSEFDVEASTELRIILTAIKHKILIGDLKQSYLNLFLSSVRYAHSEQPFIDWIFKTSFIRATHNVGALNQPVNYPVDNLSNFQDYVAEVKPYRTKIREYISDYTALDSSSSSVTDFDLQPTFEGTSVTAINVTASNNMIVSSDSNVQKYPWKFWLDNVGYKILEINVTNGGNGYVNVPQVVITSHSGAGAVATAFIANGIVTRVVVVSSGSGYLSAPTITFNGGLGANGTSAKAVAIIGDSLVRTNLIGLKFDRIDQSYYMTTLEQVDKFVGIYPRLQFALSWAPDVRIGQSKVTINGTQILRELYTIAVIKSTTNGYTQYTGTITFVTAPATGSKIVVTYSKDMSVLSATDRIQFYYNPTTGQLGKDLSQLMLGIDYGGVQVNGLGFNVSGGWGSSPYYSEAWANRDPNFNDYYVQVGANSHVFVLPYEPPVGTNINIYYVRQKTFSYISNGASTGYSFDLNMMSPRVTVQSVDTTTNVSSTYQKTGSGGFTLKVASTAGVVAGMGVYGQGFLSRQQILKVVDSTTLTLTEIPDNITLQRTYTTVGSSFSTIKLSDTTGILPGMIITANVTITPAFPETPYQVPAFVSGQKVLSVIDLTTITISAIPDVPLLNGNNVTFTSVPTQGDLLVFSNIAGSFVLKLNSVTGLKAGDVVTSAGTNFTYDTVIAPNGVDTANNCVTLNQVLLTNIPSGNPITFTRTLIEPVDVIISASGTILLSNPYSSGTIITGGTGYSVSDILTVVGGTHSIAAQIKVTAVAMGVITQFSIINQGEYSTVPPNPITVTGGTGTGATFALTSVSVTGTYQPTKLDDPNYNSVSLGLWTVGTSYAVGDVVTVRSNRYICLVANTASGLFNTSFSAGYWRLINPNAIMPTPVIGTSVITGTVDGGYGARLQVSFTSVDDGGSASSSAPSSTLDGSIIDNQITNVIELPSTFVVYDGDEFILRQDTSDGSIPTSDADYDTAITGGDLAYSTATGILADDIIIDGDGLVTSTTSPAPEEVVPGQVVDTLAIKVYDKVSTGSASIKAINHIADGITAVYSIGQTPNSQRAVIVKVGSNIVTYNTDYTVNYQSAEIVFNTVPTVNSLISIFSIGFNGSNILDIDYFVGDGTTTEFITRANWETSITSLIYLNGQPANPIIFKTDSTYNFSNVIGLRFAVPPNAGDLINYIIVNGNQQTFAVTKAENIMSDGVTPTYTLQYPIGDILPNESNMIVRIGQNILKAPNNSYFSIGSNRLNYVIDPTKVAPFSPTSNLVIYAGGNILRQGSDYSVDPSGFTVKITKAIYSKYTGQQLIISVLPTNVPTYSYNQTSGQITFSPIPSMGQSVEIISSYKQDILDIQRTDINYTSAITVTPGTQEFYTYNSIGGGLITLDRPVIDNQYIWVIKNSTLLTPGIDYKLNEDLQSIQLANPPVLNDTVTLMTFGSNVLPSSSISYMQFKDMLNRVSYKRLNATKRTTLAEDLHWNDTQIVLADASNLDQPNRANNKPGIIEIRGERIEYFSISGNVLSQLRRGTLGTGVYNLNKTGTFVQGIGASETIPYTDTTTTEVITSPGGTTIELGFTPGIAVGSTYKGSVMSTLAETQSLAAKSVEVFVGGYISTGNWTEATSYSIGDIVNVGPYTYRCITANTSSASFAEDSAYWHFFVGNIRLKNSPYSVFNINNAPYSPAGDVTFPADFTVDGVTPAITLTNSLNFGTRVTVVKQTGQAWDSTINILNDSGIIANFIKAAPGIWYTDYKS